MDWYQVFYAPTEIGEKYAPGLYHPGPHVRAERASDVIDIVQIQDHKEPLTGNYSHATRPLVAGDVIAKLDSDYQIICIGGVFMVPTNRELGLVDIERWQAENFGNQRSSIDARYLLQGVHNKLNVFDTPTKALGYEWVQHTDTPDAIRAGDFIGLVGDDGDEVIDIRYLESYTTVVKKSLHWYICQTMHDIVPMHWDGEVEFYRKQIVGETNA